MFYLIDLPTYALSDNFEISDLLYDKGHTFVFACLGGEVNPLRTVDLLRFDGILCDVVSAKKYQRKLLNKVVLMPNPEEFYTGEFDDLFETYTAGEEKQFSVLLGECLNIYHTHVRKNSDYGSAAISLTGMGGIVTRTWDKMARILNLSGFRFDISNVKLTTASQPKYESLLDSWRDLAGYALIALTYSSGAWANNADGDDKEIHPLLKLDSD